MAEGFQRKIKIIVNPNAGAGKGRRLFPLLRQKLLERNISFHLQFSESPEHVTFLSRQAQQDGYQLIISGGGDGTIHRALQPLVGSPEALGFLPLGRGNDLPKNLGIGEDLDRACDLLKNGRVEPMDVIQVNSEQYLAGVGGVGFGAEVNALANRLARYLKGNSAYLFPALFKSLLYRPERISLSMDHDSRTGLAFMVAIGNTKSYGKGMQITPLAEPRDGLLDICWIDPVKKLRLYRFLPTVYAGDHIELPEVHYFRSAYAKIESPTPLLFYGDGELIGQTPLTLRVIPKALRVLVP